MLSGLPAPAPMLALPSGTGHGYWFAPQDSRSPASDGAAAYGAPINITFAAPAAVPPPGNGAATLTAGEREAPAVSFSPASGAAPRERRDLTAISADAPPVDRSRIARDLSPDEREAADVILAFRAACLVDTPGGIVVAADVARRYRHWAGERALGDDAFLSLLADVTGLEAVAIGGSLHIRNVALRAGASLKEVAA